MDAKRLADNLPGVYIPAIALGYQFDGFKLYEEAPYSVFNF